jgi:Nif-specific regulatory protein
MTKPMKLMDAEYRDRARGGIPRGREVPACSPGVRVSGILDSRSGKVDVIEACIRPRVSANIRAAAMSEPSDDAGLTKLRRERDLYRRLLELGRQTTLEPLLRDALALIVEVVGARQGYLALHRDDDRGGEPRWWIAHGFSPEAIECVRAAISRGIIATALATGETIATSSALLDPRFNTRQSVLQGRIEAVLCAPIGDDVPRGVVYLQGCENGRSFGEEDRERAEFFARHLASFADRLLLRAAERNGDDPMPALRHALRLDGVVGRSPALVAVLRQAALLAPLDVNVLLTGDSGTGKSQLARIVHDSGPRAGHPFVEVNCASLPEALLESELFGALAGAHSTATRRIDGKVSAAEHGTLFLDEICDLAPTAQAKLLQLIQSREYYPLGGVRPVQADVRVMAATNSDIVRAVAERRFREDLFYRLQVMPVRVPSLAERREDVPALAAHFCDAAARRHRLGRVELSPCAIRAAEATEWPGNVRQLAHAVEAGVIRAAGDGVTHVEKGHLFPDVAGQPGPDRRDPTFQEATRRFQAELLREVLEDCGWNVSEAAQRLDLARSHVYSLIRIFGLTRK